MNEKILARIRKCLQLSGSSNQNEAIQAMRMAQSLMQKYGVDEQDIQLANIYEQRSEIPIAVVPNSYIGFLANVIASAFSVSCILKTIHQYQRNPKRVIFIGVEMNASVATYCFELCMRQLNIERRSYIKQLHKNCKPMTKQQRADQFCEGWIHAIKSNLPVFDDERSEQLTQLYLNQTYPDLSTANTRTLKITNRKNYDSLYDGQLAGSRFEIHTPLESNGVMTRIENLQNCKS